MAPAPRPAAEAPVRAPIVDPVSTDDPLVDRHDAGGRERAGRDQVHQRPQQRDLFPRDERTAWLARHARRSHLDFDAKRREVGLAELSDLPDHRGACGLDEVASVDESRRVGQAFHASRPPPEQEHLFTGQAARR